MPPMLLRFETLLLPNMLDWAIAVDAAKHRLARQAAESSRGEMWRRIMG